MMTVIVFKDDWKIALKDNSGGKKRKTQKVGVETRCNARQGIGNGIVGAGWAR